MKLTCVVFWDEDPKTGCTATCPEFGVEARGTDPFKAKDNLKREIQMWMLRQDGALPLKGIVSEIEVPVPTI